MSISAPKLSNPCKKFIEFKGGDGVFRYFDKSKGEKGENVEIPLPVKFLVLDELSTIKGWNEALKAGIYSNEVHDLQAEDLTVRCFKQKGGVTGKYSEIKESIMEMGGKFCKSVYAGMISKDGKSLELCNFQIMGAALKPWIESSIDKSSFAVVVKELGSAKKGKVTYSFPIFQSENVSTELIEQAVEMDKSLQRFLTLKKIESDLPTPDNDSNEQEDAKGEGDE